jgi:hypothetical protein
MDRLGRVQADTLTSEMSESLLIRGIWWTLLVSNLAQWVGLERVWVGHALMLRAYRPQSSATVHWGGYGTACQEASG